jgi:membrane-associated protease RseP (regulator of RpoE activity)
MHEFLVAIVSFIVLVGLMVVVHEFGHFAVAKFFGVRVESFSVGFGPRLSASSTATPTTRSACFPWAASSR